MKARMSEHPEKAKPAEKPVSLAPLSFKDALKNLAEVKPEKKRPADH